jgi:hypothetical protein
MGGPGGCGGWGFIEQIGWEPIAILVRSFYPHISECSGVVQGYGGRYVMLRSI